MLHRIAVVAVLLILSIAGAIALNTIAVFIVSTVIGNKYADYLWRQFYVMGFIVFYTLYIYLDLVYILGYKNIRRKTRLPPDDALPPISIVVPAYNESKRMGRILQSILSSSYPRDKMEIIVVDDGSSDDTYVIASRYPVKVIRHKKNMGRGKAIETGVKEASYDIVVTIDADTLIDRNALKYIATAFMEQGVGGACGRLVVVGDKSVLGYGQYVEYSLGYAFTKTLRSLMGWMLIPSGAFSAYRRSLILDANVADTLAEDFDLGLHIIKKGYRLKYVSEAVAYTEIPRKLGDFIRQRVRWSVGGLQVIAKHHDMFLKRRYGIVGLFGLPFHFIIGYAVLLMEFFGLSFLATLAIVNPILNYFTSYTVLLALVLWLFILKIISIVLILPGAHYARKINKEKLYPYNLFCYWIIYYYILLYSHVKGILTYLKEGVTRW